MTASHIDEIRDGLYRTTTYAEKLQLAFNQFFIRSRTGAVVCVETGMRAGFPALVDSLSQVGIVPSMITDIVVPHFEVDEMGALPDFIAANPSVTAYGHPFCAQGLSDIFGVRANSLRDGQSVTLSGVEIVPIFTKHVHQWDSLVVYLPGHKALLSSDLFMQYGESTRASDDALGGIIRSIERSGFLPSLAHLEAALRKIQTLDLDIILTMHGPAVDEDIPRVIAGLIDYCRDAMRAPPPLG
jgi:flavorubredoxin